MKAKIVINDKEIEIEISKDELNKLCPKQDVVWKPKKGNSYWSIDKAGMTEFNVWCNTSYDNNVYARGNGFQTKTKASTHNEWLIARKTLMDAWAEANDGWIPNWDDTTMAKFCLVYDNMNKIVDVVACSYTQQCQSWEYLKSEKIARELAKKYEKEWLTYKEIK